MLQVVTLDKKESEEFQNANTQLMYVGAIVSVTSFLAGIVFFNKLPLFSRIQSKWGRFFARTILFAGPIYAFSGYTIVKQNIQQESMYQKYFNNYAKYKCTGNVLDLNPNAIRKLLLFNYY